MATPFVGEIRMFGGNFAPVGWMFCDGQLLLISEYETLFNLIGTTYGGDGQSTFALPDLRGRVPVHQGGGLVMGQLGGSETVTLAASQMPAHTHSMNASSTAATPAAGPTGVLGASATTSFYGVGPATTPMAASALAPAGGTQPHENMAPFQAVSFIISLFGIFPSPS
jgi:microcystin-dependent protein